MKRFRPDPSNLPTATVEQLARLDAMTDAEVTAAALSDPDNPPMTDDELARMRGIVLARRMRERLGLSQAMFAKAFQIDPEKLRDLEDGRAGVDKALLAYVTVIAYEPETVRRILAEERHALAE